MTPSAPLPDAFRQVPLAHRALHDRRAGRPENSRAAIRAAIEAGYSIEIDVQLSSDGQAMVFHDDDLDRLTDATGPVRARTVAELSALHLLGTAETIPTLADVLHLVGGRVPLLIEIKDQSGDLSETDGRLEAATATALQGYAGPIAVMSFNPRSVTHMAHLAPQVPRGLTTAAYDAKNWHPLPPEIRDRLREIADFDPTGASFISHEAADLTRPRVASLKAQGSTILCWTIRSPEAEATARKIAQNITFESYPAPSPA